MNTTNQKSRILYFDGLRGIAALMVVNEHFLKIFAPVAYIDEAQWPAAHPGIAWLAFPPFNLLGNGAPAVTLFFVLSGWVLSRYIESQEKVYWLGEGVKRYVRLMLPCLASLLLILGVMQFGDFGASAFLESSGSKERTFQSYEMNFMEVVAQGLYGAILLEDFRLNPPLWTISVEFYGAIFIFTMALLWSSLLRWRLVGEGGSLAGRFIIPVAMLFITTSSLLFGFFLGMLLHLITSVPRINSILAKYSRIWVAPGLIIGLVLFAYMIRGSFDGPYISISFWGLNKIYEYAYNAIGAGLILLAVYHSPRLQTIFSSDPLLWLGQRSFSIYLTHYVVFMSVAITVKAGGPVASPESTFYSGLISIACVLILAHAFEKYVDRPAIQLSKKVKEVLVNMRIVPQKNRIEKSSC